MTTKNGPARLRVTATRMKSSLLLCREGEMLEQMAAQWEADLSARDHAVDLAGINAEAANELERRAERAEAALERAREEVRELRAALELARALLAKWDAASDEPGPWPRRDTFSECVDDLASALAAAPEGKG